jgi:hypothetical protein
MQDSYNFNAFMPENRSRQTLSRRSSIAITGIGIGSTTATLNQKAPLRF